MAQKLKLNSPVGADALILKWPVPTSEGKDGPEDVLDTIRLVCDDFPELKTTLETRILKDGEDVSNYDYEQTKAMCERYNKAIDSFRQLVKGHPRQKTVSKQVSMKQLKHILQQCYNHSVKDPEKLNHYEPFSPEVYGETSFELVEQMIKYVQFSESDYFIDLGSGVGQVVLQVSAATNCKFCYGVEKAEWPAEYAAGMEREFRKWMKWYGKEHGEFKIEKGDFLHDGVKEKLSKATIVFVNNFAFGPVVDHELKQRFANCLKEGARIVSSKAFCPLNFRITARNLSDIGTIMQVEELSPLCGAVSWTGKPFAYYVHTIDRTLLEKYFNRLRHPSKKDEIEPRKDRKGRPLLSIKDKINGALSAGSDSNSSGRWRRVRGLQRDPELMSPLSAAKVLDFDSGSNSSFTNSGGAPTVDESSIVYGPTTRRQWNEYVKRPQSQSGTENDNDSSAADVANIDVKSKDQAEEITQKKKKMKTVKRLNNGALGKRQMQVGKKAEPLTPVKSKAAVKLRPRQKQMTRSSAPKRAVAASVASTAAASVSTTTSPVSSNVSAHTNGTVLPPSLDSLNLLHAHTVMSTSGKDPAEKVNYNDRRMTETLSAYFKPTVQKQTVSMLEKEAGFLQMIETMKQRFLSFLTFMQSPEYRAMLLLQIEQEKRKNTSLKGQTESLEKDISILQKDGVRLIKDRLKEMGIKADTPRELISQAKDIMLRHHELKSQTASLGAQINALQTEHNHKITAHRKAQDRKFAMRQPENSFCEHTYHMVNKEHLDQQRLLANINRLNAEIQHLQNVNKSYVARPEAGIIVGNNLDIGLGLPVEGKGVLKGNGTQVRPQINSYTKEKLDMKENYEAFGTVLAMVKKEVTAALQNSSPAQTGGQTARLDAGHVGVTPSMGTKQDTTDRTLTVTDDLKTNPQPWCSKDAIAKTPQCSTIQSFKAPEASVKEIIEGSTNMPQTASSWTTNVRKDGSVTSTSPRILPAGMKIDIKKPSRLNGLNSTLKAKVPLPGSYTLLQNSDNCANQSYKVTANGSFSKVPTFNLYTENEKSAAEDLISLKDILSTPTTSIEHQGPVINTVSSLSSTSLSCLEYVQTHIIDSKTSIMQHSSHDNKSTILLPNKPHIGSSSNSLSKDSSISCAITPASSTSHVFAQVPVANFSQTGSSNQILGTASLQVRTGQNKVGIVTSLPKNGLQKHKNLDSSIIHRPVKVRTIEPGSEVKLSVPSILSSAFYAQSQQQAPTPLSHASGASLTHVLKSEPGHLLSNQSLNAHMSQTVVVSNGNLSTVGTSSFPFVTIQSPHAIPVSSGSNGVQPSLIKILQQKPIVITPKSSSVFNGSANNSGCNGSLIAVSSPALTSQGALAQAESISGHAVKILPPNGRDAKGCLHSTEPCSLVVSEFDEFVAVASPEHKNKYGGDEFQESGKQASTPDSDFETLSESSEELIQNKSCSNDDVRCNIKRRRKCRCYPMKFCKKRKRERLIDISKLSSDSDISSPDNTNLMTIPSPLQFSDLESTAWKGRSSPNKYSNSPSVILKREARLEKMAECISDGESRRSRTSGTQSRSADYEDADEHFESKNISKPNRSENKLTRKSLSGRCIENQTSDADGTFILPSRKRHLDSRKSCEVSQLVHGKKSADKVNKSEPDMKVSPAVDKLTNRGLGGQRLNHQRLRKDREYRSKSYENNQKHSSCRNKVVVNQNKSKDGVVDCESPSGLKFVQCVASLSTEIVEKTGSSSKKSAPSRSCTVSDLSDQSPSSAQQEKHVKSEKQISSKELRITRLALDKHMSDSKYCNNEKECCSPSPALVKSKKHLLSKRGRSEASLKSEKHSGSSVRLASEKRCSTPVSTHCSSLKLTPKSGKQHTLSSKESNNCSPKKSCNSSEKKHTEECLDLEKTKLTSRRRYEEKISSSRSRSSSAGKKHYNSVKSPKKYSPKEKDISPGPPKLERAVSPPSQQIKYIAATKLSSPNSESCDSFLSDSDSKNIDLWSQLCENTDKRISCDRQRRSRTSSSSREKTRAAKGHQQPRESSVSPRPFNKSPTKGEMKSFSPKITRNSVSGRQKSYREEMLIENNRVSRSKRSHELTMETIKSRPQEKLQSKPRRFSMRSRSTESRRKTQLNDKTSTKLIKVHEKSRPLKSTIRNTSNFSLHDTNPKEINNKTQLGMKDQSNLQDPGNLSDNFPTEDTGQSEASVNVDSVRLQNAELDKAEPTGEFASCTNLDSPYGLLTPKSISRSCQMEEDRHSDSSGGENLQQKDSKSNLTHLYGLKLDLDIKDVHFKASFECPEVVTITPPEAESFPFPPTPGKTPRSASLPCSPSTETNIQSVEEPVGTVSEEVKPSDSADMSVKKGPQTPPGSPLFNHQSRSRSRSPSVSSSSSRGSSYDSCHSTSSSSSLSDCSSDDTKRRKRRYQHHKTPPRKLSTLILPVSLGIGSPPKATVLYSPMPSPNINGFNYGAQIRPGLGSSSAPGFGSYSMIASALSPLSVSTQQSPGYQMVTSDSLRSPNGLIRSPVSGGLIRQHPVFPSPASSTVSTMVTSSSLSYAANKDNTSVLSCKSFNSVLTGSDNKNIVHESVQLDRDKADSIYSGVVKVMPVSANMLSSVTLDSHTAEIGTNSSRFEGAVTASSKSKYKPLDSGDIVKDHNANNTTMSCSHPSHLQETIAPIDYNQNLCLLSTSCCSTTENTQVIDAKQTNLAAEPSSSSLACTNKINSQFSAVISDIKNSSETVVPYSSQENFVSLVMENSSYQPSLLPPSAPPFPTTMSATNHCTAGMDSFSRGIDDGQSLVHMQKPSNSYLTCSLQQQQEMHYCPQPEGNHPNIVDQHHHRAQTKQQPLISQPLQQHLPSFHQTQSPPPPPQMPHHQLYMPRLARQKSPGHSPHPTHYGPHSYSYKGQNLGNRRAGFGTRFPPSHYPPHWGHLNSPVYPGPYCQNGPHHLSKPRHTQPSGQPRDIGDSSLPEHTHSSMMDYPLHGALTHPYGPGQWENPTPPHCMGSGPGGLGRPVHQHYNHLYHHKHHH